jgi:high affinity sulfate transporter 1
MKHKITLSRYVPIFAWLPRYKRTFLAGDILSGLSVWALLVPGSLGVALVCGVPVQHGLYAVAIASLVYPIFASSRHVITGPSISLAAITGAAVLAVTSSGSKEAVQLVTAITLLAGILYIIFSLLKMGWISNFLSDSVLTGFIFGIGISIPVSQLYKITGTTETGTNTWQKLASWIQGLHGTNLPTLAVGLATLGLLLALRLYNPKIPGVLLAVALSITAALVLQLSDYGVELVGPIPRGLPSLTLPNVKLVMENLNVVIPAAVSVFLVAMSASLAAAREFTSRFHYDIDINQEMLAQGISNSASGLFQGIGMCGSLSISSVSVASGAMTEMASIALGVFTVLTLLFLAPIFSYVPVAVLGAVIIEVVVFGLWKIAQMRRLWRLSRTEFWLALAALLGVLTFGILQGMLIGIALSLLWLVWRTSHPAIPVLGRKPNSEAYHDIETFPDSETHPGLVVIRFDGPLFFATASRLRDRIRELISDVDLKVKALVLDLEGTNIIDLEGSDTLHMVVKELMDANIEFHLSRTKPDIMKVLEQDGVLDTLGHDRLHDYIHEAVEDIRMRNTDDE